MKKRTILQQSTKSFKNLQVASEALSIKPYFEWCDAMGLNSDTDKMSDIVSVKIINGKESITDVEAILTITIFEK